MGFRKCFRKFPPDLRSIAYHPPSVPLLHCSDLTSWVGDGGEDVETSRYTLDPLHYPFPLLPSPLCCQFSRPYPSFPAPITPPLCPCCLPHDLQTGAIHPSANFQPSPALIHSEISLMCSQSCCFQFLLLEFSSQFQPAFTLLFYSFFKSPVTSSRAYSKASLYSPSFTSQLHLPLPITLSSERPSSAGAVISSPHHTLPFYESMSPAPPL